MTVKLLMLVIFFASCWEWDSIPAAMPPMSMTLFWEDGVWGPGSPPLPMAPPTFPLWYLSVMPVSSDGNTAWPPPG